MPDPEEHEPEPVDNDEEAPARPDGFQLVKGGTVIAYVDGKRYRLRRPRTGEYKVLIMLARERDDEIADMREQAATETEVVSSDTLEGKVLAEVRAIVGEAVAAGSVQLSDAEQAALIDIARQKAPEPSREDARRLVRKARDWNRRIGDRQFELHQAWMGVVFNGDGDKVKGLADSALPDDVDERPPWLGGPDHVGKLLAHWGADPLAPGPQ